MNGSARPGGPASEQDPWSGQAIAARVVALVEGQECDCDEQGETASGTHVCMNPRCILALADAISVEDYPTAVRFE